MTILTVKEACEILKVSRPTLIKMMKNNEISYKKYGRTVRITDLKLN